MTKPKPPVASAVLETSSRTAGYPKFSDIPAKPRDVRSVRAWNASVAAVKSDAAQLQREVAAGPAPPTDTQAFGAQAVAAVAPPPRPAGDVSTEAFARELQDRARPPAKPK